MAESNRARLALPIPDRDGLPDLSHYTKLQMTPGDLRTTGYVEGSRGCKHRCRHCPIVPVFDGRFRITPREVVLEDVARQVAMGARHITFGDPDFLNGPRHAAAMVTELHRRFPSLTYDVTIKVEHLLDHRDTLPLLRDTGCLFVTSAVESIDDQVLQRLNKGHTHRGFLQALELLGRLGLALNPTFLAFTPWTTLGGYAELLDEIRRLNLVESVAPAQYALRLLITDSSGLLELDEIRSQIEEFDPQRLIYPWHHIDPRVDDLQRALHEKVRGALKGGEDRRRIFRMVERTADDALRRAGTDRSRSEDLPARASVPFLTEPWYC